MRTGETKQGAFKRLANKRANQVLKGLSLLGNLSNRNNYSYSEKEVRAIFSAIEEELRLTKSRFSVGLKKERKVKI